MALPLPTHYWAYITGHYFTHKSEHALPHARTHAPAHTHTQRHAYESRPIAAHMTVQQFSCVEETPSKADDKHHSSCLTFCLFLHC